MPARHPHDLSHLNTLRLGSRARDVLLYRGAHELADLGCRVSPANPAVVLGGGSNVVLAPKVQRTVIRVVSRGIEVVDETADSRILDVQAGESWHGLVRHCMEQGWGGLENLALIPGTVGAAPVQNIGAYGLELSQRLLSVQAWNFSEARLLTLSREDCDLAYRNSLFRRSGQGCWLIVSVRLSLPLRWQPILTYPAVQGHARVRAAGARLKPVDVFEAVCDIRRSKLPDPAVLANAGSFFKNPTVSASHHERLRARWPGVVSYPQADGRWRLAAGWLIEQAGWKGRRLGPVGMHERQALVLVNHGGAQAGHVRALARQVKADVATLFDVALEQEPVEVF